MMVAKQKYMDCTSAESFTRYYEAALSAAKQAEQKAAESPAGPISAFL